MERLKLREAAARTGRSVTTLRRYIRSGRLRAELGDGRFGPEYLVSREDLAEAGLLVDSPGLPLASRRWRPGPAPDPPQEGPRPDGRWSLDVVPLPLYHELQMKHEQLLVQYGMLRAGGLQALERRGELETPGELRSAASRRTERDARENDDLRRQLRDAQLELEGRALEIGALEAKVAALEMLTRNAATNETIDDQFRRVMEQKKRVEKLRRAESARASRPRSPTPGAAQRRSDH